MHSRTATGTSPFARYFKALGSLQKQWKFNHPRDFPSGQAAHAVWSAAIEALVMYGHPANWKDECPLKFLPADLARNLATDLRWLLSGYEHPFLSSLKKRGRPVDSLPVQNAIAAATNYIDFITNVDPSLSKDALKDVLGTYRVSRRTVLRWLDSAPGGAREYIHKKIDLKQHTWRMWSEQVQHEMLIGGAIYRAHRPKAGRRVKSRPLPVNPLYLDRLIFLQPR